MHVLRPHQNRALAYAKPRSRIFLAMEMRTGKTAVAIRWAKYRRLRRILVVAPLTTINPGWVEELETEGVRDDRVHILSEIPKAHRASVLRALPGWHLLNYEYLRTRPELLDLLDPDRDGVILDESTRIRSPKAQITKVLLKRTRTEHRALMSGLPNPESTMNWFEQIRFLKGELLGFTNYWAFRHKKYYQTWPGGWEWKPKKGTMNEIKQEVHSHVFTLTAKQAGMGSKHVYEKRVVEMNSIQKRSYRSILKDFEYDGKETKWAPVQQTWLARLAGGFSPDGKELVSDLKLKELLNVMNELPKSEQVVVWARFKSEIRAVHQFLNKRKIKTELMTGATSRVDRRKKIQKFRTGNYRVLVVQEKLGMYGLNLSAANTDVYYSNLWENEVRSQCEKRIEHLTKKTPLLHIDLITRNSTDEEVVARLREKKLNSQMFNLILKGLISRWSRVFPADAA